MQIKLTKQDLKLIVKIIKEKRIRIFQFRDLYYSSKETKFKMNQKIERIDVLVANIRQAIRTRKPRNKKEVIKS